MRKRKAVCEEHGRTEACAEELRRELNLRLLGEQLEGDLLYGNMLWVESVTVTGGESPLHSRKVNSGLAKAKAYLKKLRLGFIGIRNLLWGKNKKRKVNRKLENKQMQLKNKQENSKRKKGSLWQ